MRHALAAALAAAVLAGCGGDDGGGTGPPLTQLKRGMDRALAEYREGDRGGAAEEFARARDEHFGRLGAGAAPLRAAFYDEVPRLIDEGVTVSALARRLAALQAQLDRAVDNP